jgi:GDP-L-fucose synthase
MHREAMQNQSTIFVAGHRGLVGSGIVRQLLQQGYSRLLLRTSSELDLRNQQAVDAFFRGQRPEFVFLCAAKVGGILANSTYPGDFIYDNLAIQSNIVKSALDFGVKKLVFLGSSCIYPKFAPQPMTEDALLTGPLEPTNEWYAIAKIAGIKLVQAFRRQYNFNGICLMPTNLYGPGDNFDLQSSHVLPALIRKFHEAKVNGQPEVTVWGSGTPRREFLHVDDLAAAAVHLMQNWDDERIVNVGTGVDVTIRELAELVSAAVGYTGAIVFDPTKPDGTPRKLLDVSRLQATGWRPSIELADGIRTTYQWYLEQQVCAVV